MSRTIVLMPDYVEEQMTVAAGESFIERLVIDADAVVISGPAELISQIKVYPACGGKHE